MDITQNTSPGAGTPAATPPAQRRVIDAPTRLVHWALALSFAGAYVTAEQEAWHGLHISFGYTALGLALWRLLWGLLGPRRSRLAALASRVRGAWQGGLEAGRLLGAGQAAAALSLLGLALLSGLSGLALDQEWLGEALEELHEASGELMLFVVLLHLGLLAGLSLLRQRNAFAPMFSGRQAGSGPDLVRHSLWPLALGISTLIAAFWAWQWNSGALARGEERHGGHERHSVHDGRDGQGEHHRGRSHDDDD
ncbi:cytochrome b/b6 domain-containing protein [Mitsuaria sp. WAJ17]|uniref:cytochrome b/b6 domain-containing protein n=1 Tax=Mitsuaria sp. WAJ17 TaxID=2761452 RepID=UPI0016007ABF|nr:cytochrome b/b6 domain-containing protein [Mitsuaria sp. WAJ17]MBB2483774.1 cytochrome b/b6 domain-containing protein [Mitsuaria sp. WAJ17]